MAIKSTTARAPRCFEADNGTSDDGSAIEGDIQTAYSYIGGRDDKRFTMMRAHIESEGALSYSIGTAVDFEPVVALMTQATIVTSGTKWNTAKWNTFKWSGRACIPARMALREQGGLRHLGALPHVHHGG